MKRWRGELTGELDGIDRRFQIVGPTLVGRTGQADVVIDELANARYQVMIVPTGDGALLGELSWPPDTYVDGRATRDPTAIDQDSSLRLGGLHLRWEPGPADEVEPCDPRTAMELAAGSVDPEPWLVHADWLSARGHPRGELIVIQHRLEHATGAERTALEAREAALRRALGDPRLALVAETWRLGYRRTARVNGIVPIVRVLCDRSSAYLEELTVGLGDPTRRRIAQTWIDPLVAAVAPRVLIHVTDEP